MIAGTQKEPGALAYEWHLSSDRTQCRLIETYADAKTPYRPTSTAQWYSSSCRNSSKPQPSTDSRSMATPAPKQQKRSTESAPKYTRSGAASTAEAAKLYFTRAFNAATSSTKLFAASVRSTIAF